MRFREKLEHYFTSTHGMQQYLRLPREADWKARIAHNLEHRDAVWVETLRRTVYGNARNPYRRMLALAGCTLEDLAGSVRRHGVENTLRTLREAGVRLSHDEFKGNTKIIRNGEWIPAETADFGNPLAQGWLEGRSSGSRSKGSVTLTGSAHLDYLSGYAALNVEEFRMNDGPYVIVRPILPGIAGLYFCLFHSRLGSRMGPWFVYGARHANSIHYRALTSYIVAMARLRGWDVPAFRYLPQNDFAPVAHFLAAQCRLGRHPTLQTVASVGARVAAAARENGLDLSGTLFVSGGEPLTAGKRSICESAGMRVHPAYWVSEIGQIGHSCGAMRSGNSVHVFADSVGLISETCRVPFSEETVQTLQLTSLLPHAPYVLINCEMGDCGIIEQAHCSCTFARAGFRTVIRDISSFGKLTGLGMTLVGSDLLRILEHDLPERFGGAPSDYQLAQKEAGAQTELTLRINPRLPVDVRQAREFLLERVGACYGGALATRVLQHAEAIRVIAAEPLQTSGGKTLPLHIEKPDFR
jgi:hypothetical protein